MVVDYTVLEGTALTVNRLGDNRVLIVLCEQDIEDIKIDFDNLALRSRVIGLTRSACRSKGLEIGGKRVNIEALPLENSCYLLVTVGAGKRYKIKKANSGLCVKINGAENFLRAVEQAYLTNVRCTKNSAYKKGGEYFLIFDYPAVPQKLKRILSEYGEWQRGKFSAARVRETAEPVCKYNAVEVIGREVVQLK